MLSETAREQAIAVMNQFLTHPITFSFHELITSDDSLSPSVSSFGLVTVRDRLSNGHYPTISD
jgi:hypothetical protein